jgi:zinc protease
MMIPTSGAGAFGEGSLMTRYFTMNRTSAQMRARRAIRRERVQTNIRTSCWRHIFVATRRDHVEFSGMRLRVALIALVVASQAASPAVAQTATQAPPPLQLGYSQFTLPSGLHVILHEDHRVPVVTVNTWYHVGSARERMGRTGLAHLFEHLMFMGSGHVKPGEFDELLEAAGGENNASTETDRTNYYINVPSNALELALFLESDRMGYLLDSMTPQTVDAQRDVVKNERRQSYENRPYGIAEIALGEMLYPEGHPYHWPVIGYMADLTAASYDDVVAFFRKYYAPSNASLVVAGDINPASARRLVETWFSDVKAGSPVEPMTIPGAMLTKVERRTVADKVQLPRLYLAWLTPRIYEPGNAAMDIVADVLAGGKNSRLYKRLVYDTQIAQDVAAAQESAELSSSLRIVATPRPGHTVEELQKAIDEEILKLQREGPSDHELQRAINQAEASFYNRLERVGGFGGVADQLNGYYVETGNPDWFREDLARYRALSPSDVRAIAERFVPLDRRVELIVEPEK